MCVCPGMIRLKGNQCGMLHTITAISFTGFFVLDHFALADMLGAPIFFEFWSVQAVG